jgi:hypothetical protein
MLTPERSCHGGSARKIHSVDATGGRRDGVLRVPPHTCGSRACDPRACDPHVRARVRSASDISPCPLRPTFALLVRMPLVYRMPVPKQYRGALEGTVLSRSSSTPTALSSSPALCLYTTALSARSAVPTRSVFPTVPLLTASASSPRRLRLSTRQPRCHRPPFRSLKRPPSRFLKRQLFAPMASYPHAQQRYPSASDRFCQCAS